MPKKGGGKMKNKSGARMAMLYGYVPCRLGLCGPGDKKKQQIIAEYLRGDEKLEGKIREIISEFKGAYPYYQLIADCNRISDPLDWKVVEAYWLGNVLLEKVGLKNLRQMMKDKFVPLGKMPAEKVDSLPGNAIPFHNFHVLAVGSVTGKLKETLANMELCRVSWGEVLKVKKGEILVSRKPLKFGRKISLGDPVERTIHWNNDFLPEIKEGDWISVHWNYAVEKISPAQVKNLAKYTQRISKT